MKKSFDRRRAVMAKKAYRKAYGTSVLTVATIVMLVIVIITLSVIIAKNSNDTPDAHDTDNTVGQVTNSVTEAPETDEPFDYSVYKTVACTDKELTRGSLVLVNRNNAYELSDSVPLINLFNNKDRRYTVAYADISLENEAFTALGKLTDAFYAETGKDILQVTAGHRTKKQQEDFYSSMVSSPEDADYYELAGFSDHHTGYSFDVKLYFGDGTSMSHSKNAEEYAPWIVENYYKYGFVMRYPGDKTEHTGIIAEGNHFRYVGIPHSAYMHENNLCLEEYISYLKNFSVEKPLQILTGGKTYYVYYTQKTADSTDVYVPSDGEYTLSGNNTDGFIVTYSQK